MSISTNPYQMLIDKLHTKERNILISHAFIHGETKLCLLDFIGASQYFITDFGTVWWRQKFCPEKNGKITNGWVPMVERDVTYPSPWVFLSTTIGNSWWPVNQLLGWAFHPVTDDKKIQYFVSQDPYNWSCKDTEYIWTEHLPESAENGLLAEFMKSYIYGIAIMK